MRTFCLLLWCIATAAIGAEAVTVPIEKILTTSAQDGMLRVREAFPLKGVDAMTNKGVHHHLKGVLEAAVCGASNVFLVDATTPGDAVKASTSVFIGARSAEIAGPVNEADPIRGSHWLVAVLGLSQSEPANWAVEGITVNGDTVTLTYRKAKPSPATCDTIPYYYWAPLGKLNPGVYRVELYDADEKAVTLMRRVIVEPEK